MAQQLDEAQTEQEDQARQLRALRGELAQLQSRLEGETRASAEVKEELKRAAGEAQDELRSAQEQCRRDVQDARAHAAKAEREAEHNAGQDGELQLQLETEFKQRHAAEHARDAAIAERDAVAAERDALLTVNRQLEGTARCPRWLGVAGCGCGGALWFACALIKLLFPLRLSLPPLFSLPSPS